MKRNLFWLLQVPKKLHHFCSPTEREREVADALIQGRRHADGKANAKKIVLVQCVEDIYYYGLFGKIANALTALGDVRIEQFVLRSVNVGESGTIIKFLYLRLLFNRLLNFKWISLYRAFCDGIAYRNTETISYAALARDFGRAFRVWRKLNTRDDLTNLVIDDIRVGDLVNDTYLRFKPAPTVDLGDRYLLAVIWQAFADVRRAKKYFSRAMPVLYLTSYSTYTQHGIPVRVALRQGVKVFAFGNYQEFSKALTLEDWVHTKNPLKYAEDFSRLDNPKEKLAEADKALAMRMNGGIDTATAYMKTSAYIQSEETPQNLNGAIVVFLHDFFDSPHVYYDMVFPDFWTWITFTLDVLIAAKIRFFIKPHPNQIGLSGNVIETLKKEYPEIELLSSKITNTQLAEAGIACAITIYGTVAHEMAYLQIPSITCARHPHVAFDFCKNARNEFEYKNALFDYASSMDKQRMREQSLAFYWMHNLNMSEAEKALSSTLMSYRMLCAAENSEPGMLENVLENLEKQDAFGEYINMLSGILHAGNFA
jgi:hypothetical protein